ncbi:MAG: lysoplasmalogenase [Roseovarius sp.]
MPLVLIAALAAVIYLLRYCQAPAGWPKSAVKTLSVAALACAAWLGDAPAALTVALCLCALGDYLLARDTDVTFLAGVGAFALGHLAYVVLFLSTSGASAAALTTPTGMVFTMFLLGYGAFMMWRLYCDAGPLRIGVMAYVPIILAMGLAAVCVPAHGALWLILPAAVLFMISDSVLAADLFILRPDHPVRRITAYVIWAFYWLAQLGFWLAYMPPQ